MKLDYLEIGNRIQLYRKKKRIKQGELAKAIGVTSSQISHIETGISRPSLDVVAGLCEYFQITSDELIFGKKSSPDNSLYADNREEPAISYADLMNPASADDASADDSFELDAYLVDCPKMDQEILVEVVKTVKKGLLAARLSTYNNK